MNPTTTQRYSTGPISTGPNSIWTTPATAPVAPVVAPTAPVVAPTVDRTPVISPYQQSLDNVATVASSRADLLAENQRYAATQRQARIDAINTTFAPRIAREKEEGDSRMSRIAALNFNQGIVGSGADTTKTGEQKGLNEKALQNIEDTKAMAIQAAFDKADELARQMTEDQYSSAKNSAEANVVAQKNKLDSAKEVIKSFGAVSTTLENLKIADPKTYQNLLSTGMSDFEISNLLTASNPEAKVLKTELVGDTVLTVTQIGNKMYTETHKTDIKPEEKFQAVDGVGYGVTNSSDGKLVLRPLTTKKKDEENSSSNFTDIMQQSIDAGATPEQAAREAALSSEQSGIQVDQKTLTAWTEQARKLKKTPVKAEEVVAVSKIEQDISDLSKGGILNKGDIRLALRKRGYSEQEINNASVSNVIDRTLSNASSFFANLFGG